MTEPGPPDAFAQLNQIVRQRLEDRVRSGDLPLGLDAELDRYVAAFAQSAPDRLGEARAVLDRSAGRPAFSPTRVEAGSRYPGGRLAHGIARKLVNRPIGDALSQVQAWRSDTEAAVASLVTVVEQLDAQGLPAARDALVMILDRMPVIEALEVAVADIERRLERLEQSLGGRD